ncbi:hypothetical protein [Paracoccus sp. KR1-242]|uniref:hypothetical protein n=1 Tax=Paracoccus sp. KR1-242 TaxID=3410028 RepID=UPI003BFC35D1
MMLSTALMMVFFAAIAGLVVVFAKLFFRSDDLFRANNITEMDFLGRGRLKLLVWWLVLIIVAPVSGILATVAARGGY